MRIVIVGPGALGSLFASRIALQSAHDVWIVDHDKSRAARLAASGLKLIEGDDSFNINVQVATSAEQIGVADLVLLCVKSQDVAHGLEQVSLMASDNNLLIALQNGISHHAVIAERYPGSWAVGVTAQGASLVRPGVVKHGGNGDTVVGFISEANRQLNVLDSAVHLLNEVGFNTVSAPDIESHVWNKFIVNIGINAMTVLHDCPNGQLLEYQYCRSRMATLVKEASRVALAKGIAISSDPVAMVEDVCRATAINISSMLQDRRRQRLTEVDAINGALVAEAKKLNIAVPENEEIVLEIKKIESSYDS